VIKLKVPEQEGETAPKNFFWNLPHPLTTELLPDVLDYRNPRLADLGTSLPGLSHCRHPPLDAYALPAQTWPRRSRRT